MKINYSELNVKIFLSIFIILFLCSSWFLASYLIYNYGAPITDHWYSFPVTACSVLFIGWLPLILSIYLTFKILEIE